MAIERCSGCGKILRIVDVSFTRKLYDDKSFIMDDNDRQKLKTKCCECAMGEKQLRLVNIREKAKEETKMCRIRGVLPLLTYLYIAVMVLSTIIVMPNGLFPGENVYLRLLIVVPTSQLMQYAMDKLYPYYMRNRDTNKWDKVMVVKYWVYRYIFTVVLIVNVLCSLRMIDLSWNSPINKFIDYLFEQWWIWIFVVPGVVVGMVAGFGFYTFIFGTHAICARDALWLDFNVDMSFDSGGYYSSSDYVVNSTSNGYSISPKWVSSSNGVPFRSLFAAFFVIWGPIYALLKPMKWVKEANETYEKYANKSVISAYIEVKKSIKCPKYKFSLSKAKLDYRHACNDVEEKYEINGPAVVKKMLDKIKVIPPHYEIDGKDYILIDDGRVVDGRNYSEYYCLIYRTDNGSWDAKFMNSMGDEIFRFRNDSWQSDWYDVVKRNIDLTTFDLTKK